VSVRVAGVELGGTKSIAVLDVGGVTVDRRQVPTTTPAATLGALVDQVVAWHATAPLAALGIASFGPLRLDPADAAFGQIAATPKPSWSNASVRGAFAARVSVPIGFDTDVAGAALAEGRWGAARGCADFLYLTVGTGVGVGIVANRLLLHGAGHPEAGHIRVRRTTAEGFAGVCPFHGDCLEGLVAGPALAARTGLASDAIPDDHPVWAAVAAEIAEAVTGLILTLAPQRIVVGGGITMKRRALLPMIVVRTAALLGGYLPSYDEAALARVIVPPGLGNDAGPRGAIALGLAALADAE
jgi:fructokinase